MLCWTHSVIGWGFFLFSFWIPAYLASLGLTSLSSMGALSALPWAVCRCQIWIAVLDHMHALPAITAVQIEREERHHDAGKALHRDRQMAMCAHCVLQASAVVAVLAGAVADSLRARWGWRAAHVRQALMQTAATLGHPLVITISTRLHLPGCVRLQHMQDCALGSGTCLSRDNQTCAGPAASLLPLAFAPRQCGVAGAVACITAFMGLQAFAYAGFHAYIQASDCLQVH